MKDLSLKAQEVIDLWRKYNENKRSQLIESEKYEL